MLNRADHAAVAAGQADELANLAGADSELIAPDSTLLATDPTPNCAPPPAPRAAATLAGLPEHLAVYQRYLAAPPPHAIGDSFPDLSRLALTTDFRRRQDTINRSIKSGHTSGSVGARQKRQLDSWQKRIIAAYRDDKRLHNHRRHHAANTELVTAETGVDEALLLSGTGWSGMQRGMAESPTKAQDLLARGFRFVASHGYARLRHGSMVHRMTDAALLPPPVQRESHRDPLGGRLPSPHPYLTHVGRYGGEAHQFHP